MESSELAKELAGSYLPTRINQFGCLVVREAEGTASGPATFIDVDGHTLSVTADHVAERLAASSGAMSLFTLPGSALVLFTPKQLVTVNSLAVTGVPPSSPWLLRLTI